VTAASHPEQDRLVRFGHGLLPTEERQIVEAHVTICDECAARLTALDADSLALLLRHGPDLATCPASTPLPASPEGRTASVHGLALASGCDTVPERLLEHPRYRVIRLIGRGGMGNVYLAEHRRMDRLVALKVIDPSILGNPEAVRRFRQEVKAAARLTHPNVVQAFDADEAGGQHFLVLEYVEGESLAAYAAKAGPLPPQEACEYARQAAVALQYAHEAALVHRDVKPHNLMRTPDGRVKVLDFGLARVLARQGAEGGGTEVGSLMGTPDYVAPEQAGDAASADGRADVYALGCTLYHLLTGRAPFPGGTAVEKVARHLTEDVPPPDAAGLPAGLAGVVARMTARDPEKRFQTAGEAAAALAPFAPPREAAESHRPPLAATPAAEGVATGQRTTPPPAAPRSIRGRGRVRWAWAALVAFVGFAGLAGAAVYRITTDKGELVIQAEDKHVEVLIKQGGEVVEVYDPKSKQKLILRSGAYELELKGKPTGLKLDLDKVTLKRGDKVIARIQRTSTPAEKITPLHVVKGTRGLAGVSISPNGRYFVAVRPVWEGIIVFDTKTGEKVFERKRGALARFSPDSTQLITCEVWTDLHVYDLPGGREVRSFDTTQQMYFFWRPAGNRLLYQTPKGKQVWDWTTGKKLCDLSSNEFAYLTPDGRHVFQHSREKPHIRVLDAATGKETDAYPNLRELPFEGLTSDGKRLLRQDDTAKVRHYDVRTGKEVAAADVGLDRRIGYSGDHRRLLTHGKGRDELNLFDVTTGKLLAVLQFPEAVDPTWNTAEISDDGTYAVVIGPSDATYVFRLPDPAKAEQSKAEPAKAVEVFRRTWVAADRNQGRGGYTQGLDLSPDGRFLLSSHWGGVRLWEVATGKVVHELPGGLGRFTSDAKQIVILDGLDAENKTLHLHDAKSGKLIRKFGPPRGEAEYLNVCPDGETVWTPRRDTATFWDLKTGELVTNHEGRVWGDKHKDAERCNRLTGDVVEYVLPGGREALGRRVLEGNAHPIYALATGKLVRKIHLPVPAARISHNSMRYLVRYGNRVAFGVADGTIFVMDLLTGQEVARVSAGNFVPRFLCTSADDRFVAACGFNVQSDLVVWRLPDPPAKDRR
jgi:WD40 repeat protein